MIFAKVVTWNYCKIIVNFAQPIDKKRLNHNKVTILRNFNDYLIRTLSYACSEHRYHRNG